MISSSSESSAIADLLCNGLQRMFKEQVLGSKFVFGMIIKGGVQSPMGMTKDVFVKVLQNLSASSCVAALTGLACCALCFR